MVVASPPWLTPERQTEREREIWMSVELEVGLTGRDRQWQQQWDWHPKERERQTKEKKNRQSENSITQEEAQHNGWFCLPTETKNINYQNKPWKWTEMSLKMRKQKVTFKYWNNRLSLAHTLHPVYCSACLKSAYISRVLAVEDTERWRWGALSPVYLTLCWCNYLCRCFATNTHTQLTSADVDLTTNKTVLFFTEHKNRIVHVW